MSTTGGSVRNTWPAARGFAFFWPHSHNKGSALDFVAALNAGMPEAGDTSADGESHQPDWRLPSVRELHSLSHCGFSDPALSNAAGTGQWTEGDPFAGVVSSHYWSSTTYADVTENAWFVHLGLGTADPAAKMFATYAA